MDKENACYNCAERTVGCHSTCEKYAAFAEETKKRRQEKFDSKTPEKIANDYLFRWLEKNKHRWKDK